MPKRNVIVIGGSAGATGPLARLLQGFPAETPAYVLVALHLSSLSNEWLTAHLAPRVRLPVHSPREERKLKEGEIVVACPDHHLIVMEGLAVSTRGPRENLWRPAVDVLFRSAAVAYGSRVIGVLLSGELDDGTAGLQAIKLCGGVSIIQAPGEASSPAMPRTALANVTIDYNEPLERLPALLLRLIQEEAPAQPRIPPMLRHEAQIAFAPEDTVRYAMHLGSPSPLSCPECAGPLWPTDKEGSRYRCLVGHAFGLDVLLNGADQEIDRTLWAAIRLFEQRVNIARMLAEQERRQGHARRAELYDTRARESQAHAANLRQLHSARVTSLDDDVVSE